MLKPLLLLQAFLLPQLIFSQYCTSGGPTSYIDSNVETVLLNGENSNINFTGCPGVIGVQDLTNNNVFLNAGDTYSIDIHFSTCGGDYAGAGEAWIDFNQDDVFDTSESIGTWSGTPPVSISTFNFTVPSGVSTGSCRLRIMQQEGATNPMDPCASFAWGSVMDFSVYLQNGVDCSTFLGDESSNPIEITTLPFKDTSSTAICYTNNSIVYPSPDVFYKMIVDQFTQAIVISLCESSFDTYLTIFDGQLNPLFFNDDASGCGFQSRLVLETSNLDTIYIAVEGWGNNMGDYIIDVSYQFVGINEMVNTAIYIYPNPTNSSFQIKGTNATSIEIVDNYGRIIEHKKITNNQVNVQDLSKGIYFVLIHTNNKIHRKKLIIK